MNEFESIKLKMNDYLIGSWYKLLQQISHDDATLYKYTESCCYDLIHQQVWIQVWGPMYDKLKKNIIS